MHKLILSGLSAVLLTALIVGSFAMPVEGPGIVEANAGTQWNASYFNNTSLSGTAATTRVDDQINFNWADGAPSGVAVGADNFSVRWTKSVNFPTSGQWTFRAGADDGIRMWIDTTLIIDKWLDPGSYQTYTVTLDALTSGNHDLKVEYYEHVGLAGVQVAWWSGGGGGATTTTSTGGTGAANWTTQFYNTTDLSGSVAASRTDGDLNFDWGTNAPASGVNADSFSARFTARVNFPQTGRWTFRVGVDDGIRVWIDVTQIINEWHGSTNGYAEYQVTLDTLTSGDHDIKVEYFDASGGARVWLRWENLSGATTTTTTSTTSADPEPTAIPKTVMAGVTGDFVNVRSGPGLGYPVVRQIFYPKNYEVVGGVPDLSWLLIDLGGGVQGWASNDWVYLFSTNSALNQDTTGGGQPDFVDYIPRIDIEVAPPASLPTDTERTILQGLTTDTVNLRDGPSAYASQVIGSVPAGVTFDVEAHNGNGVWYLINYRDIRGWVNASYVKLTTGRVNQLVASAEIVPVPAYGQVFVPTNEQGEPAVTVRGRASENLKMRDGASLFASQIASVPQNTEFVVTSRNANGAWYLITVDGQQGWVNASYVTLIEGTVPDLPVQ